MTQRVLTGIKPTGMPHIGNLLGMYRPALAMQDASECYFFVASYHALTTMRDPALLRQQTIDVAANWLALGLDPEAKRDLGATRCARSDRAWPGSSPASHRRA